MVSHIQYSGLQVKSAGVLTFKWVGISNSLVGSELDQEGLLSTASRCPDSTKGGIVDFLILSFVGADRHTIAVWYHAYLAVVWLPFFPAASPQ